jgi:hypothetical protein
LILKTQPGGHDDRSHENDEYDDNDDDLIDISHRGNARGGRDSNHPPPPDIESRLLALTVQNDSILLSTPPVQPPHHSGRSEGRHSRSASTSNDISKQPYSTPPRTFHQNNNSSSNGSNHIVLRSASDDGNALRWELARIQGLLGSVMKKRYRSTHGSSIASKAASEEEVRNLRAALEQQEVATSLRQADSSFLQAQLEEKDNLLAEVSKLLETVEERQSALEAENLQLRTELEKYKHPP